MANRSALEVAGCLYLAKRSNDIEEEYFLKLYSQMEVFVKMIQGLINSLKD